MYTYTHIVKAPKIVEFESAALAQGEFTARAVGKGEILFHV